MHDTSTAGLVIARYPEPLGNGRAVMRCDIIVDGELIVSHLDGSPAPLATVQAHASTLRVAS